MTDQNKDITVHEENESTAISNGIFPSQKQWQMMQFMAKSFYEAGALPKGLDTVPKVIVAMQAGAELGLKPVQSLGCIGLISGKPMLYGNMPMAIAMAKGHKIEWGQCDGKIATVTITRGDNGKTETATLTMAEAQERGLNRTDVWKKYPERMLRYGVFRQVATFLLPDVYNGIKIGEDEEVMKEIIHEEEEKKPKALKSPKVDKPATLIDAISE